MSMERRMSRNPRLKALCHFPPVAIRSDIGYTYLYRARRGGSGAL